MTGSACPPFKTTIWLDGGHGAKSAFAHPTRYRSSARRVSQRSENSRPRTNALVEALQVVFFVRRMDVVVVQTTTHQHRVETERALEIRHDRDRGAGTHQDRFLAPLLGQCALGRGERLHLPIERNGQA